MYQQFFKRLYHNVYRRIKSNNQDDAASITLSFTIDGKSTKVAENQAHTEIHAMREMAEFHQPDSIMAEVVVGGKKKVYRQDFINRKETTSNTDKLKENIKQSMESKKQGQNLGYIGLGEVSVDEYINKKLDEDRKARRMADLEDELIQRKEEITQLNRNIEKLEVSLESSEQEVENLQADLEAKKKIRYWAGLTGDILESIGVKKETLKEPLAGLINSEGEQSNEQKLVEDQSGIIDENPSNDKRNELISLIHDYLRQVDDTTLSNIFLIFSDIEQDKSLADYLINQIKLKKQNIDASI